MAITGPIPLPGNFMEGFGKGFSGTQDFFSKLTKQKAEQAEMERLKQLLPFEKQLKQAQINKYGQEAELNPLHKLLLQEQLKKSQLDTDPMALVNYLRDLQKGYNTQNNSDTGSASNGMVQGTTPSTGTSGAGMPPSIQDESQPDNGQQGLFGNQPPQNKPTSFMDQINQNPDLAMIMQQRFPNMFKETPQQQSQRQIQTEGIKEQQTADIKKMTALREELPEAQRMINRLKRAEQLIENHKSLFGPGTGGLDFLGGPGQRKRNLKTTDDRKVWGELESLFGDLVGEKAQQYSHRGLAVAFDLAKTSKASFNDQAELAKEKLRQTREALEQGHLRDSVWYKTHGGEGSYVKNNNNKWGHLSTEELQRIAGGS
jgi:hypothetical protein